MTDVVDGLRLSFDFLCHCEEAKPTWQSVPLLAVIFRNALPFPPGAHSFCLSKKNGEKNDTKGRRLVFAPANTCTLPFDPLPRACL